MSVHPLLDLVIHEFILIFQEGIAVGRSLGLLKNEPVDGNKEMIAFGLMNICGSFTSCYLTTGKEQTLSRCIISLKEF